jgi:ABC-2 type transport system permease protein
MIGTLLRIGFINLRRDRVVQALTFLLPVMFFSIFAVAFGDQRNPTRKVRVAVVDEDRSEFSIALASALRAEGGLQVQTTAKANGTGEPLDRPAAEGLVKAGAVPVAVVLPKGLGATHSLFGDGADRPRVRLLADVSDPIAPQMVMGLLQKVNFTAAPAAPASMAAEGMTLFEKYGGPLTPGQQKSKDEWLREIARNTVPGAASPSGGAGTAGAVAFGLPTEIVNVMQPGNGDAATISFYAAGIGVMFLLFSCSGAGGTLLEEQESGTLGRLMGSRAGMSGVLIGKWLFVMLVGGLQLTVMFTWGAVLFGLPLLSHLLGFVVMTVFTTAAASGFGLVLATLSRSRQQLSGMSTIIILAMSALGGSMFPRFLMSETMQKVGLVTFNAWALEGYLKVFWREAPIFDLWPEVAVLSGLTAVFLFAARRFARRWETL